MKVYVSGPMTGYADFNFPAFDKAKADLLDQGFEVVSPADFGPEGTWEQCLRRDLRCVLDCDAVVTLPGWTKSKGASLEVYVAKQLKIPVVPLYNAHKLREAVLV